MIPFRVGFESIGENPSIGFRKMVFPFLAKPEQSIGPTISVSYPSDGFDILGRQV
jgi:hypothetical protein